MKLSQIKGAITSVDTDNDNDGDGGGKKERPVNDKNRADWNKYVDYLDKKGMKGHPSLDKGGNDVKMINQFRKEDPTTTMSKEMVTPIQKEFSSYRTSMIQKIKDKKALMTDSESPNGRYAKPNENLDNYMKDLSVVDGIAGQRTTMHKFPDAKLKTVAPDKTESVANLGFAKTNTNVYQQ